MTEDSRPAPRSGPPTGALGSIRRAVGLAQLRMRLSRVIGVITIAGPTGVFVSAAILAAHKILGAAFAVAQTGSAATLDRWALTGFGVVVGVVALIAIVAFALPLPKHAGALALERVHGLNGRLSNALEFSKIPAERRDPFMDAAIEEACEVVEKRPHRETLATSKAAPLFAAMMVGPVVAALFWLMSLGVLAGVAMVEIRTPHPEPPKPPPPIQALELSADDLDLFRDAAKELERGDQTPEVKNAIERFNRLIEDLAAKRLERDEAFRQMDEIERDLLSGAEADRKRLEEEMKATAKELEKSDLAKPVAESMKKADLKQAEEELKKLAAQLKDKKKKIDKAQLEKLREALKRAAEQRKQNLDAVNQRRSELSEQLLKKKKQVEAEKDPNKKREEERLLRKKERELERLDREAAEQQRANRELERLDRELSQAAQDLMRDLGITQEDLEKAAKDLEQAAEDLNRMEQESMSQKDKEELKKKLEELREILRQDKQGGKKRQSRMVKFSKRARGGQPGQSGQGGEEGEEGEDGKNGKQGQGKGQGEGEDGEGEGQGGKGKGKGKGQGSGDGDGDIEITLGPGGVPIPMNGGSGQGPGDQPGGDGSGQGGKEAGSGSGGPIAGDKTDPKMGTVDVEQQGLDAGNGPTNSKVIQGAAEKGFRGADYKKVFTDYRTVAEENIDKEKIPDGYRFYVQRYFQLIRPRD